MSKPITAALLKRCQNENLQCLAGLRKIDPEAAEAIAANHVGIYREYLHPDGCWYKSNIPTAATGVYRLRPDTPVELPYVDTPTVTNGGSQVLRVHAPEYGQMPLSRAPAHKGCLGFLYGTPEAPVLRTVLDLQYGQPYAVRFRAGS